MPLKTIFPNKKPHQDKKGNVITPTDILTANETGLNAREYMYLLGLEFGGWDEESMWFISFTTSLGKRWSRTTMWRVKKSLQEKGYL